MELLINLVLFALLLSTAIAILRIERLFAIVILSGVFSLLSALLFVTLDAVDVAFTEAAVGAGISGVLMLSTLALTNKAERPAGHSQFIPFMVVLATGALLVYGSLDMPMFGDPDAPAHTHVGAYYLAHVAEDIHVPNVVTAVLASYRGFDTLGEVVVVFTAAVGVLLIIGNLRAKRRHGAKHQHKGGKQRS